MTRASNTRSGGFQIKAPQCPRQPAIRPTSDDHPGNDNENGREQPGTELDEQIDDLLTYVINR